MWENAEKARLESVTSMAKDQIERNKIDDVVHKVLEDSIPKKPEPKKAPPKKKEKKQKEEEDEKKEEDKLAIRRSIEDKVKENEIKKSN